MSLLLENQVQLIDALKQIIVIMEKTKRVTALRLKWQLHVMKLFLRGKVSPQGLKNGYPHQK
uniref:Uncharacterized protein n=1 Tax=Salmonella enterica subsp. salamae TaxID=59202 RepID=I3W454_SALER|nr:hypothetical protein [Salmonella enterica subsp. salamae]